jgi:hypothetical protein
MALRLAVPLAVVAILGLWSPDPLVSVLGAIRAVLGASGG